MLGISIPDKLYILHILKQYDAFDIFVFLFLNHKISYKILICTCVNRTNKNGISIPDVRWMCAVNSSLKLRQVVLKLFQCLISSIWFKMLFKNRFLFWKNTHFSWNISPKKASGSSFKKFTYLAWSQKKRMSPF